MKMHATVLVLKLDVYWLLGHSTSLATACCLKFDDVIMIMMMS